MAQQLQLARTAAPQVPTRGSLVAAWLRRMGGTVEIPGQPTRYHFTMHAPEMPEEVREEARNQLSILNSMLDPASTLDGFAAHDAKLGIAATLLMGLAGPANVADDVVHARYEVYEMALESVPAWAVAEGAKRWLAGDCSRAIEEAPNFKFPPSPTTLKRLAETFLVRAKSEKLALERLIGAVSLSRALDPTPLPRADVARISADVRVPQLSRM